MAKQKIVTVPSYLMENFLIHTKGQSIVNASIVNNIIAFCVYKECSAGKQYEEVCNDLQISYSGGYEGMKKDWIKGEKIADNYRFKHCNTAFSLPLPRLFDLRDNKDGFLTFDDAVCQLMFWALGSIQGKAEYQKTNDIFLLSRMDGKDKPVKREFKFIGNSKAKQKHDAEFAKLSQKARKMANYELSPEVAKIGTRRKMERYKRILTSKYKVSFYTKARGFYFSTKLTPEQLAEKVEEVKRKKPFRNVHLNKCAS